MREVGRCLTSFMCLACWFQEVGVSRDSYNHDFMVSSGGDCTQKHSEMLSFINRRGVLHL
jgi:hypothetical protein